jgi:hypothetical protein
MNTKKLKEQTPPFNLVNVRALAAEAGLSEEVDEKTAKLAHNVVSRSTMHYMGAGKSYEESIREYFNPNL